MRSAFHKGAGPVLSPDVVSPTPMPSDFVQTQVNKSARGPAGEVVRDPRLEPVAGKNAVTSSAWSRPISTAANPPCRAGAELRRERAIGVEPLLARKQSFVGLIFGDARAELGAFGNVGRVAQDEVERLDDALGPVAS